ncbi:MAG: LysR family transcriptional regulator [Pseudomonadota bacterium]
MELRHLRTFRAIAEMGGVHAAAARLNVAQPAVSRTLRDLEAELGFALFDRIGRGLRITDAGAAYLRAITPHLDGVAAAGEAARLVAEGRGGILRVGLIESGAWDGAAPAALDRFARTCPDVRLDVTPMGSRDQVIALADRDLDCGFLYRQGSTLEDAGLAALSLRIDEVVLAANTSLDFGHDGPLSAEDIDGLAMIGFPRAVAPDYFDAQRAALARIGVEPQIVQVAADETAMLALVSAGVGCALVNGAAAHRPPPRVRFHPVAGISVPITFVLAHRDPPSTLVKPMIAAARTVIDREII